MKFRSEPYKKDAQSLVYTILDLVDHCGDTQKVQELFDIHYKAWKNGSRKQANDFITIMQLMMISGSFK